jgi:hypothetical protein
MRIEAPLRACGVFLHLVGFALLSGCAAAQAVPPGPQGRARTLAGDTALFAAVLRSLPRAEYHDLAIDPRIIKDDPNVVFVHPGTDFMEPGGADVEARATVIAAFNASRLSGPDYRQCDRGPGGLSKADSATLAQITASNRRPYCVILGVPRPGGPYFPIGSIDRRAGAPAGAVTVRTVTIDPGEYTVYDIVAVPRGSRWDVVERTVLFQGWS